jgi:hypothetical protein
MGKVKELLEGRTLNGANFLLEEYQYRSYRELQSKGVLQAFEEIIEICEDRDSIYSALDAMSDILHISNFALEYYIEPHLSRLEEAELALKLIKDTSSSKDIKELVESYFKNS